MRYLFLVFFVAGVPLFSPAMGLGDWAYETPGGNVMYNYELDIRNGEMKTCPPPVRWYFYKGFILGRMCDIDDTLANCWFALNESSGEINYFNTQSKWEAYRSKNNLVPKIWTRWYDDGWSLANADPIFGISSILLMYLPRIVGLILFLAVLFLLILILYKAIWKEHFNFRKPYTLILCGLIAFIVAEQLLSDPSSL